MFRVTLLLAAWAFVISPCSAEIYKWVDEEGNVHFGDRPKNAEAEQLKLPAPAPPSPTPDRRDRLETQQRMLDVYREEREQKKQAVAEEKARRKRLEARCNAARDQLRNYKESQLYDLTSDGERKFLTDSERQATIDELAAQIKKYCE